MLFRDSPAASDKHDAVSVFSVAPACVLQAAATFGVTVCCGWWRWWCLGFICFLFYKLVILMAHKVLHFYMRKLKRNASNFEGK